MKPGSPLNVAQSPAVPNESRKFSLALSINLPPPKKGLQKNLLENSLTSKLKQHRHESSSSNKENLSRSQQTIAPKRSSSTKRQVHSTATSATNKSKTSQALQTPPAPRSSSVSFVDRNDSAISSIKSIKKHGKNHPTHSANERVGSATSDHLPKLSPRKASSLSYKRSRASSAETVIGRDSLHSGISRLTSASSFFHSSDSSGFAFESRGADHTIKVVKKDGVFQPIDKYAPCRYLPREFGQSDRTTACDYQLFTLPVSGEDTTVLKPNSRDQCVDGNKRPLKVSWSKTMENATNEDSNNIDGIESRVESVPPPVTPNALIRAMSSSSFKRPIYSSGKSRVQSIGLRWRVPTAPPDEEEAAIEQSSEKPMWSWLVTPETKQKGKLKGVGQLLNGSRNSSTSCLNRINSNLDVRTQHSRDLHPVSTAMAREGTSVSKTKWFVPSSSSSTQEAERLAMDRLEMVKRERKPRSEDTDAIYGNSQPNDMDDNNESDGGEMGGMKRQNIMDDTPSCGTKSNIDSLPSPAKSRSTY